MDSKYLSYKEKFKDAAIQKKIAFRSGLATYVPGFDCWDNAKALFDYMIANHFNDEYELVWFVHNPDEFPQISALKNVKVVSYEWENSDNPEESDRYFYELFTSEYIFFTDTDSWLRYCREGQVRVNLWHGCGFKDRKAKNAPGHDKNYDFMTVTSSMYGDIHAKEYGVSRNKMIDTGLAKEDLLFMPPKQTLSELLDIPNAGRYVFWLPTFRLATDGLERLNEYTLNSDTGLPIISTMEKAEKLNSILEELDIYIVVKLHPVQKLEAVAKFNLSRISIITNQEIAAKGIQINSLLSRADALISDYSSAAVDYILLDRPTAFALEDVEEYKESRGFIFENIHDYLPGKEIYNFDDFVDFIKEVGEGTDSTAEKRRRICKLMHTHQDGNNCKRILEAVGLEK